MMTDNKPKENIYYWWLLTYEDADLRSNHYFLSSSLSLLKWKLVIVLPLIGKT